MRWMWKSLTITVLGGLLCAAPTAAQKKAPMPPPTPPATTPAPAPQRIVILDEPVGIYDPFYAYPYPYTSDYMDAHFGYVKIDTKLKDVSVYVDGGFANKIDKAKKFALRPGNHQIEVRDNDGRKIFQEQVAVLIGKTTKLKVG